MQRLLLEAALSDGDLAIGAWERARASSMDVDALDLASCRLLPQIYRNLVQCRVVVDDPVLEKLGTAYRLTSFRNQRLFEDAATVIRQLRELGVDSRVFKGAAMSTLYHRDAGVRPMADVDLLVRPRNAVLADRVLERHGWRRMKGPSRVETLMRFRHGCPYRAPSGSEIDLHWCPLHEPVAVADFWEARVPVRFAGVETHALAPADELLVTCAHGLLRHDGAVRWIADAVVLIRAAGEDLDWGRLVAQAHRFHLTARVESALRFLDTRFDVAVPPPVLAALREARRPAFERISHRLLTRPPRRGLTITLQWDRYRRLRLLDALPGRRGFLRYLRDESASRSWRQFAGRYARFASASRPMR